MTEKVSYSHKDFSSDYRILIEKTSNGYSISAIDLLSYKVFKPKPIFQDISDEFVSEFIKNKVTVEEKNEKYISVKVNPYKEYIKLELGEEKDFLTVNALLHLKINDLEEEVADIKKKGKVFGGRTEIIDWKYYNNSGIYVDVDISHLSLINTPIIVTSIHGNGSHWTTTGGSSVYEATNKKFRIYIKTSDSSSLTTDFAISNGWHIQYIIYSKD